MALGVAEEAGKRDKIDIHRKQHQLDGHQQDDHVLAVDDDPGNADAKQHRAQGEIVSQRNHGVFPSLRTAAILTRRTRSALLTCTCRVGSWCLVPGRRRRVIAIAAMMATVRIAAATANGSRTALNRARATHWRLLPPATAAGPGPAKVC